LKSWQTKSSKIVYENPWLFVREDEVINPNGKDGLYGVVESKSDGVFVVPVDTEGNSYIIKQEHYTTREMAWQCVAGRTDGEAAEVAARRELLEEAGLRAKTIIPLSVVRSASGIATFRGTICLARDLEADAHFIDKDEGIAEIKKLPLSLIKEMIMTGEIVATESIAAFFMAIAYLEKEAA